MTFDEFLKLGRQMRNAQRLYFRSRNAVHLRTARELEQRFDDAIRAHMPRQASLLEVIERNEHGGA